MTNDRGVPLPELRRIFTLIKEYDTVLATGHISPEEIRCVVDSARNIGVQKIVITHPEYWVVDMSLEDQQELISDYNVILERCFMQPLKNGQWISNAERNLKAIRKLGAENSILSTDCGNPATPPWEESMRQYLQFMADHNVSRDELRSHVSRELSPHGSWGLRMHLTKMKDTLPCSNHKQAMLLFFGVSVSVHSFRRQRFRLKLPQRTSQSRDRI